MKFSVLQENLSKGLQTVSHAVSAKPPMPILANVLICTENGKVKLAASNLETAVTTYVNASVESEGSTTVPAKMLKDFILNLSPSTIKATLENDILHIHSEKTKSRFNGVSSDDFPPLPSFTKAKDYTEIDSKEFANALNLVIFSAGTDNSRPIFTGVYLNFADKNLTIASTDGYRLSEKVIGAKGKNAFTVVIPAKIAHEVGRVFSSSPTPIKFVLDEKENLALFESEDTLVATRILEGQYPNYKAIVPTETKIRASFSGNDLLEAVKLTSIFSQETNKALRITFDPEGHLKVNSLAEESGEHESIVNAEVEADEPVEVAFNSRYLLDFLNNVKAETLSFGATGSTAASIWKTDIHENFFHLIMPVQV